MLDELESLPWVLGRIPEGMRAIVVDNGSSDGSGDLARRLGATVVDEPLRGFGAACYAGLIAASAPVVAFMDADSSLDPRQLERVCTPVLAGEVDLVLGARIPTPGSWPWHARAANRVLTREIRRRTGLALDDLGPMRAARRQHLLGLELTDRAFGWPLEMVLRAHRDGWRIEERPVTYHPRVGRSKVTGTVRGTRNAIRDMSRHLRAVP